MKKLEVKTGTYTMTSVDESGKEISESKEFNFFLDLRASTKLQFINNVVSLVVGENYYSVLRDIVFDIMLVNYFTDVDITYILEAVDTLDQVEDFLLRTNVVDIVKKNINQDLLKELNKNVDYDIEYKTGVHHNDVSVSISNFLNSLEDKIMNIDTESMMDLASKLSGMTDTLTTESIVEAYAKTDIFKGNQASVIDEKTNKINELTKLLKTK